MLSAKKCWFHVILQQEFRDVEKQKPRAWIFLILHYIMSLLSSTFVWKYSISLLCNANIWSPQIDWRHCDSVAVGTDVGLRVGLFVGFIVGLKLGFDVGILVGVEVGIIDGLSVRYLLDM